jgi:hypothetical protein
MVVSHGLSCNPRNKEFVNKKTPCTLDHARTAAALSSLRTTRRITDTVIDNSGKGFLLEHDIYQFGAQLVFLLEAGRYQSTGTRLDTSCGGSL